MACCCGAEHACEVGLRHAGELAGGGDPDTVEPDGGRRPDPPDPLDREWVEEGELVPGWDEEEPVGLRDCAGDLGQVLGAGDADRDGQTETLAGACSGGGRRSPTVCRRSAPCPGRRGTPRRSRAPRRTESCPRRARREHGSPPRMRPCEGRRRAPAGRAAGPGFRPSPSGRRRPLPRSWPRVRRRHRRSPAVHASGDRRAARRTRRTHRRRHAGSSLPPARTRCLHIEHMFA